MKVTQVGDGVGVGVQAMITTARGTSLVLLDVVKDQDSLTRRCISVRSTHNEDHLLSK